MVPVTDHEEKVWQNGYGEARDMGFANCLMGLSVLRKEFSLPS